MQCKGGSFTWGERGLPANVCRLGCPPDAQECACVACGRDAWQGVALHVCMREEEIWLVAGVLLESWQRRDASQPVQQPGSACRATCVTVPGACERLPCLSCFSCVCDCVQALCAELERVPAHALCVPEPNAGVDAEQCGAQN